MDSGVDARVDREAAARPRRVRGAARAPRPVRDAGRLAGGPAALAKRVRARPLGARRRARLGTESRLLRPADGRRASRPPAPGAPVFEGAQRGHRGSSREHPRNRREREGEPRSRRGAVRAAGDRAARRRAAEAARRRQRFEAAARGPVCGSARRIGRTGDRRPGGVPRMAGQPSALASGADRRRPGRLSLLPAERRVDSLDAGGAPGARPPRVGARRRPPDVRRDEDGGGTAAGAKRRRGVAERARGPGRGGDSPLSRREEPADGSKRNPPLPAARGTRMAHAVRRIRRDGRPRVAVPAR